MTETRVSAKPLHRTNDRGLPTLQQISLYGTGDMEPEEFAAMFQPMIDSGAVWHFPIEFIHTAVMLLQRGICSHEMFAKEALERTQ
ncbi:MAG TPA: hypothetical protein VMW24_09225 [Sedimentisphaerales bacterium]|nr:hypothetical protein [Sedimentisphaerales bacterium]